MRYRPAIEGRDAVVVVVNGRKGRFGVRLGRRESDLLIPAACIIVTVYAVKNWLSQRIHFTDTAHLTDRIPCQATFCPVRLIDADKPAVEVVVVTGYAVRPIGDSLQPVVTVVCV